MVEFHAEGDDFVVPRPHGRAPPQPVPVRSPPTLAPARRDAVGSHRHARGALRTRRGRGARPPVAAGRAARPSWSAPPRTSRNAIRHPSAGSSAGRSGGRQVPTPAISRPGEILRRKGLAGELELLPLGVDVDRFHPVDRDPPTGELRVGYVGRLIPHKGVAVLLQAIARDHRLVPRSTVRGPQRHGLAELAGRLAVADRVVFHGHVDEVGMPDVYPTLDVLAVPSVPMAGWVEQFGRVVVEAQASGVPVVASASGALPDVVGDRGLLVPPGDPAALGDALVRLLDEPGLWSRLAEAGTRGAGRYSWERVAGRPAGALRACALRGRHAGAALGRARRPPTGRAPRAGRGGGRARTAPVGAPGGWPPPAAGGPDPRRAPRGRGRRHPRRPAGNRIPAPPTVSRWAPPSAATTGSRGPWPRPPRGRTAPPGRGRAGSSDRARSPSVSATWPANVTLPRAPERADERARGPGRSSPDPATTSRPSRGGEPAARPRPDADVGSLLLVEPLQHHHGRRVEGGLRLLGHPVRDEDRRARGWSGPRTR